MFGAAVSMGKTNGFKLQLQLQSGSALFLFCSFYLMSEFSLQIPQNGKFPMRRVSVTCLEQTLSLKIIIIIIENFGNIEVYYTQKHPDDFELNNFLVLISRLYVSNSLSPVLFFSYLSYFHKCCWFRTLRVV